MENKKQEWGGVKAEVVTITPELATDFLRTDEEKRSVFGTRNRRKDDRVVAQYAKAMENGEWVLNGEPIIVSKDDVILDGQHRLLACEKSGKPFITMLVWGIEPEAFETIGIGKARTAGDVMYIGNVEDANNMASIIARFFALCKGRTTYPAQAGGVRLAELSKGRNAAFDYYSTNTDSCNRARVLARTCYGKRRFLTPSTIGAYALYLHEIKGHDYNVIESFFRQVFFGTDITNETTLALRDKLYKHKFEGRRYTSQELTAYIHKAWNAFVSGREIKTLRYSVEKDGAYIELL